MRNGGRGAGGLGVSLSPGGFPLNRPRAGGMMPGMLDVRKMPGMPGVRKMPGMPGPDGDNWDVQRTKSTSESEAFRGQSPLVAKASPINSKLLPQGSGGLITGKTSALLQGVGDSTQPSRPSTLVSGPSDSPAQNSGPSKSLGPVPPVTPATEKPVAALRANLEEFFRVRILEESLQ